MPVSPEQRKILLERLELARKAKAEKLETPKLERKKKETAVVERTEMLPPPEPAPLPPAPLQPAPASAAAPMHKAPESEEHTKTKRNPKNKYMKVVFYSEPGKKKVENLLKSLDDDEPLPAPVPLKAKKTIPAKKKTTVQKPKEDDSLDQLARLYFS